MDIGFLTEAFFILLSGVPLTLQLAGISVVTGMMLALLVALMRQSGIQIFNGFARGFVAVFRGTPLLVQLFLIYYGLGQFRPDLEAMGLWQFFREPFWCASLALALNTAAYGSEVIRGGLMAVPFGQLEAARACGMSGVLLFRRIVFPIALRQALPAYGNEIILVVKATSLASTVTMMEITGIAHKLIAETFQAVPVFMAAGAIYLLINFLLTRAIQALEWWLSPHLRSVAVAMPAVELSVNTSAERPS